MIAARCSCLKLVPAWLAMGWSGKRRGCAEETAIGGMFVFMASLRLPVAAVWGSDRVQRAMLAVREDDRLAGPALDQLPGVALEIHRGGALAGGAGAGGTIILTLQGDAVAFHLVGGDGSLLFGLGQRCCDGDRGECAGNSAGEDQ